MFKQLVISGIIVLSGCATSEPFNTKDSASFKPDCSRPQEQIEYLQKRIDEFHVYFKNRPTTIEDRKYYGKLKNNLWSIRSSCSALQR